MARHRIKLAAAGGAAAALSPGMAIAADIIDEPQVNANAYELTVEGGLVFSNYSHNQFPGSGKLGDFDHDIGGYGSIAVGGTFDSARFDATPYDWRLTGSLTHFQDNEISYTDVFDPPYAYVESASTGFSYQMIDFDLGRRFNDGSVEGRLFAGVRAMHLEKSATNSIGVFGPGSVAVSKVGETEFLGIGPRIGVQGRSGGDWGLVAGASASILYGRFDNKGTLSISYDYDGGGPDYSYAVALTGSDSKFDWLTEATIQAGLSFRPGENTEFIVGYRAQHLGNVSGGFFGDEDDHILVHGPYLSLIKRF